MSISAQKKSKKIVDEVLNKKTDPKKKTQKKLTEDMRGKSLNEQKDLLSPERSRPKVRDDKKKKELIAEQVLKLQEIFRKYNLPEILVPKNVRSFKFDESSGKLEIEFNNGFQKEILDNKGKKHIIQFNSRIRMSLQDKRIEKIEGITVPSDHGARLTEIEAPGNGMVSFTGRVAFFSKSIEIKETDIPELP